MIRALFAALLLSACTTTAAMTETAEDPALSKALAGRTAGKSKSCLSVTDTQQSQTFKGAIIYRVTRSTIYRNDMNKCPFLDDDRIPVFKIYGSQVCRGDIVSFIDRGSRTESGSCVVGEFVPYQASGS